MVLMTNVGSSVFSALRVLALSIFELILKAIIFCFQVFFKMADAQFFDSEFIQNIFSKIGLILGLFMVFRLTFLFIEYLISPDKMTDKEKGIGNIIKKVIIVIVLLGSTRFLFQTARNFQKMILDSHILEKVVLSSENTNPEVDNSVELAYTIFSTFYRVNENVKNDNEVSGCEAILSGGEDGESIIEYELRAKNSLSLAYNCIEQTQKVTENGQSREEFIIEFEWLLAILTAVFVLYMIFVYTIQVTVRSVQLAYLEMIAPIPIMMYLNPKGSDSLKKWWNQCFTTWVDLFIRIFIMYFVLSAISMIIENDQLSINIQSTGFGMWIYVRLLLIIALVIFAKKIPSLLKEVIPSLGGSASLGFGLKVPKEAKSVFNTLGGATTGAAIGLIGGKGINRIGSTLGGFARGFSGGIKGKKISEINAKQAAINHRNRVRSDEGSTTMGRITERVNQALGLYTTPEEIENLISTEDKMIENIKNSPLVKKFEKNNKVLSSISKINDEAKSNIYKAENYAKYKKLQDKQESLKQLEQAASNAGLTFNGKVFTTNDGEQVASFTVGGKEVKASDLNQARTDLKALEDAAIEDWVNSADGKNNSTVMLERAQIEAETGEAMDDYASIKKAKTKANSENAQNSKAYVEEQGKIKQHEDRKKELQKEKKVAQANVDGIKKV